MQHPADPIERVSIAAAVTQGLLLAPASNLINRGSAELDDVESIQDCSGVFYLFIDGVLTPSKGIQRSDFDPAPEPLTTVG